MAFMTAGGVEMPCPVSVKVNNEIIWSANTGRTDSGLMVGDVVAEKSTVEVGWGVLTQTEYNKIKQYVVSGFFSINFPGLGWGSAITAYRGTLSAEFLGELGDGIKYWKSASVQLIQQ